MLNITCSLFNARRFGLLPLVGNLWKHKALHMLQLKQEDQNFSPVKASARSSLEVFDLQLKDSSYSNPFGKSKLDADDQFSCGGRDGHEGHANLLGISREVCSRIQQNVSVGRALQ